MNPPLVSTCVYTRIQNWTSGSSSGGRGIVVSAARACVARHSAMIQPSSKAPAPRVEFIYTPTTMYFGCVFNVLCTAKPPASTPGRANLSVILTTPRGGPVAGPLQGDRGAPRDRAKPSHNGQCVTVDPRRRYNMSHQRDSRGIWHARCFIYPIETEATVCSKRRQAASGITNKTWKRTRGEKPI